jgi:hypothetical protein
MCPEVLSVFFVTESPQSPYLKQSFWVHLGYILGTSPDETGGGRVVPESLKMLGGCRGQPAPAMEGVETVISTLDGYSTYSTARHPHLPGVQRSAWWKRVTGAALLAAGAADMQPRGCEWAGGVEGWCMVGVGACVSNLSCLCCTRVPWVVSIETLFWACAAVHCARNFVRG